MAILPGKWNKQQGLGLKALPSERNIMIIASWMVEMVKMIDEWKAVWQHPSSLWVVLWQIAYTFHFVGDHTLEMKSENWHQIARKKNTEYGLRCGSIGNNMGDTWELWEQWREFVAKNMG
jgi:hypothetical protein